MLFEKDDLFILILWKLIGSTWADKTSTDDENSLFVLGIVLIDLMAHKDGRITQGEGPLVVLEVINNFMIHEIICFGKKEMLVGCVAGVKSAS